MNWKNIIFSGAATGTMLAILILIVFILPGLDPGSFAVLCGGWFSLAVLSAFIVNQISKRAKWPEVSLKILIPVGCITSIIPLFGPLFGMPNSEPITLVEIDQPSRSIRVSLLLNNSMYSGICVPSAGSIKNSVIISCLGAM